MAQCTFNPEIWCYYPNSGCSFLIDLGNVLPCRYLPNPDGRFSVRKNGINCVSPAVLSPAKYVKRRFS